MNQIRNIDFSSAVESLSQTFQSAMSKASEQPKTVAAVAVLALAIFAAVSYCLYKRGSFKAKEIQQSQPSQPKKISDELITELTSKLEGRRERVELKLREGVNLFENEAPTDFST